MGVDELIRMEQQQPLERLKDITRSHTSCLEAILREGLPMETLVSRLIHRTRNFQMSLAGVQADHERNT